MCRMRGELAATSTFRTRGAPLHQHRPPASACPGTGLHICSHHQWQSGHAVTQLYHACPLLLPPCATPAPALPPLGLTTDHANHCQQPRTNSLGNAAIAPARQTIGLRLAVPLCCEQAVELPAADCNAQWLLICCSPIQLGCAHHSTHEACCLTLHATASQAHNRTCCSLMPQLHLLQPDATDAPAAPPSCWLVQPPAAPQPC